MIYATQASLTSEACREELAYALDRALNARGGRFPLITLFPATVSREFIPAAIRVRLYVSLTDPDWVERIVASAESREARIDLREVLPYQLKVYTN